MNLIPLIKESLCSVNNTLEHIMASVCEGRPKLRIPLATIIPKKFCCDDETGELVTYQINNETGEPSMENIIPPVMPSTTENMQMPATASIQFPHGSISKTKKFQALKASILAGSNTTSHRLLLVIPTLMIFPSLICVMLLILEIYLHVRCHKKNKKLNDPNIYYRSPFHIVTSTFCGVCRESDMASKVGQLQDKRRHHYDYFRRIAI